LSTTNDSRTSHAHREPTPAAATRLVGWQGVVSAAVLALLAFLCASFGLFAMAAEWIAPLLIGALAALASRARWMEAAAGTGVGLGLGLALQQPWFMSSSESPLLSIAVFVLLGVSAAAGVALWQGMSGGTRRAEWIAAAVLLAVIVGGMWITTATVDSGALSPDATSVNQWLSTRPELGNTPADRDYYLRLFYDLHDGQPYYDAYVRLYKSDPMGGFRLPNGVPGYRLPTIFYLWLLLPPDGAALPWAFLVFATLAVGSAFSIGAQLSRPGVAVAGALAVAVAYTFIATSTNVLFVDGWAMAIALAGIALFTASVRKDSRRLLWGAAAVLFAAAAFREILIYPTLLALASALMLPRHRRWREAWPWLVGLGAFVLVYIAHILAIAGRVDPQGTAGFWTRGGVGHLAATVHFLEQFFGGKPWLLPVLVLIGLAGALGLWRSQMRLAAFLSASIAAPLLSFLVLGNGGVELATGAATGYWGVLVVPIALALVGVGTNRMLVLLGVEDSTA